MRWPNTGVRMRYLILGPASDPAGLSRIAGSSSLAGMFVQIASRHTELTRFTPCAAPKEDNVFTVLVVDAGHVPGANTDGAARLASWLGAERARRIIASFGAPSPLFEPA